MRRRLALIAVSSLPLAAHAQAALLRIGTVVPKNSAYHQQLLELGEAWKAAQGGAAKFTVFTDGSQGGEAEIVRRMRIGQLQGGMVSGVGLREIEPATAVFQSLPLLFRSWDELDHVREKMRAGLERRIAAKGFVVIAWGDAGWVRFFSKTPALRPADFKQQKFFSWGSEPEQQAIMKSLGYIPVPLEVGDVLPAIQTGMIQVVPSTPYFALASQVFDSARQMLELNWGPIVGALVVTQKAWEAMSPAAQQALKAAGDKAGTAIRAQARREVDEATAAMVKRGLVVNKPNAEQLKEWQALADQLYPRIRGSMVPADTFDELMGHVQAYRAGKR